MRRTRVTPPLRVHQSVPRKALLANQSVLAHVSSSRSWFLTEHSVCQSVVPLLARRRRRDDGLRLEGRVGGTRNGRRSTGGHARRSRSLGGTHGGRR